MSKPSTSPVDAFKTSGSSPGDFVVHNHGSIVLLEPLSSAAFQWVQDHLPDDRLTFGSSVCIEPRYLGPILKGIKNDGLVCL